MDENGHASVSDSMRRKGHQRCQRLSQKTSRTFSEHSRFSETCHSVWERLIALV